MFAASLFAQHPTLPYVICGAISLLAAVIAWQSLCRSDEILAAAQRV
jgi:hypothetical protein